LLVFLKLRRRIPASLSNLVVELFPTTCTWEASLTLHLYFASCINFKTGGGT
jgi:hypothetical protein